MLDYENRRATNKEPVPQALEVVSWAGQARTRQVSHFLCLENQVTAVSVNRIISYNLQVPVVD
jgi:hypothetical protein